MTSFKQKLKSLLTDSSLFKDMSNIDQKFDQFFMLTYKKIKKDNAPRSLLVSKCSNNSHKSIRNYFKTKSHRYEINKGISPKTAKSMIETFSIIDKEKLYNNYQSEKFYNSINKYLDNSSKIQRKIQKSIDYINKDNYNLKSKCSMINRPKSIFNNENSHSNKNKSNIYNLKKIYEETFDNSSSKKEIFRKNPRKDKLYFNDFFNQFRNRQKFICKFNL